MKWKHHGYLLAQRAVNTLKVHIVLHEPLSCLYLLCTGFKKMFRKLLKILNQQDPNFFSVCFIGAMVCVPLPTFFWLVSGPDVASSYFFKSKSVSHLNHEPSFGYRCYRQWLLNKLSKLEIWRCLPHIGKIQWTAVKFSPDFLIGHNSVNHYGEFAVRRIKHGVYLFSQYLQCLEDAFCIVFDCHSIWRV